MNSGNCVFLVMLYTVFRNDTVAAASEVPGTCCRLFFFSDEKVFTVASPVNLQNDRVYATSNAKLRDIAPECMLRCRPTFSSSLTVSVAVSKLGCTELFFVEPRWKWTADTEMISIEDIASQSSVVFETRYTTTTWLKGHNFRGSCLPR